MRSQIAPRRSGPTESLPRASPEIRMATGHRCACALCTTRRAGAVKREPWEVRAGNRRGAPTAQGLHVQEVNEVPRMEALCPVYEDTEFRMHATAKNCSGKTKLHPRI